MKKQMSYMDSVHRDGRIWNLSVMVLLFAFPVSIACIFGVIPDWGALAMGLIATAPMYWVVGVIETVTYVPMLGAGGSYLSFVTGNISNLKLPCAINALEQNGVSANSEEGEIISTISIAVSSIVTTFIIIIGVIFIVPLQEVLQQLQKSLVKRYQQAKSQPTNIQADYASVLFLNGKWAYYKDDNGEFEGRILYVEPRGYLHIEDKAHLERKYAFKEVQFLLDKNLQDSH